MVRKSLLLFLTALAAPTLAQPSDDPPPLPPDTVRDFMDAIPQLEEVPYDVHTWHTGTSQPLNPSQTFYHYARQHVVAHSFIQGTGKRDTRGRTFGQQAVDGFAAECIARGGYLEPDGEPFRKTLEELSAGAGLTWIEEGRSPYMRLQLSICSISKAESLGALAVTHDLASRETAIVLIAPGAVVKQLDLDEQRLAARAQAAREYLQERREADRLPLWRQILSRGSETACGPILSINGDLVEVADPRTRQPRWYRRGELLPAIRLDGEPNQCR